MPTVRDKRAPKFYKDGEVTRHELAIRMLVNSHPDMCRNGFAKAVRELWIELHADEDPDECTEPVRHPFLPDAYRIDREAQEILVYEVEDTCPISPEKLLRLAYWWFQWDADDEHEWLPRVFVVDRYGNVGTEIDLMAAYYAGLDTFRLHPPTTDYKR